MPGYYQGVMGTGRNGVEPKLTEVFTSLIFFFGTQNNSMLICIILVN